MPTGQQDINYPPVWSIFPRPLQGDGNQTTFSFQPAANNNFRYNLPISFPVYPNDTDTRKRGVHSYSVISGQSYKKP